MAKTVRTPVKFDRPPVVEVVCGVLFNDLPALRVPHIGLFWSGVRADFPNTEERPPLTPLIELPELVPEQPVQIELLNLLPLPRVWLVAEDGRRLLQIQRDRFLFNWKRATDDDPYPSYANIIVEFDQWLARFRSFIQSENLGELSYRQYELTYVNHVGAANGLNTGRESALLVDHVRAKKKDRFLPPPDNFNWRTSYPLPERQGRLHLLARNALKQDGQPVIRLDVTARGIPEDHRETGRRLWFDLAHEWITHGFADATLPAMQKIWGRTQ